MKALITGANGFLGVQVVKKVLSLTDYTVRCFLRSAKNLEELELLQRGYPGRIEILRGSLLSKGDCNRAVVGVDIIYHLAAAKNGAPAEMFLNSSVATDRLLTAVIATGQQIKVVFCSSFSVYGVAGIPHNTQIDELTPLEQEPLKRDIYSLTKSHQEALVKKYHVDHGLPVAILRPGVIYGPGSSGISPRVGLDLFGTFFHLGGNNSLPLTYVENCAEAFVFVSQKSDYNYDIYNIVDDSLITSRQFLKEYKKKVKNLRTIPINYTLMKVLSWFCEKYHTLSQGQLPDVFTRYKTASIWRKAKYSNQKLKKLGWCPSVCTEEGLNRYFEYVRKEN